MNSFHEIKYLMQNSRNIQFSMLLLKIFDLKIHLKSTISQNQFVWG